MNQLGRFFGRAAKMYSGFYAVMLLSGIAGFDNPFWRYLYIVGTQIFVRLVALPGLETIIVSVPFAILAALILLPWTRRPASVLLAVILALSAFALHFLASFGPAVAPRRSAVFAILVLGAWSAVRRGWWRRLGAARPLRLLFATFFGAAVAAGLAVVTTLAGLGMSRDVPVGEARQLLRVGNCYEVEVLGDTGRIAALCRQDGSVSRVDARTGTREAIVRLPGSYFPHSAIYDPETARLFVVGYDREHEGDTEGVAVIRDADFTIGRWLPMPGCWNGIDVDIDTEAGELVALCEDSGLVFFYDLHSLASVRTEKIDSPTLEAGYDIERVGDHLLVTAPPWPHAFRGRRRDPAGWSAFHAFSTFYGVTGDPNGQRFYVAQPVERRIAVFDAAEDLDPLPPIRTEGMVRDLAIDPDRGWLFSGSYFRGIVEQFDTKTGQRIGRWQVGGLLRGIAWDPLARSVYTASVDGVRAIDVR